MKNLKIISLALLVLLGFTACEDSVGPTVNSGEDSPKLTSHSGGESFELTEDEAEEELMNLSWTAPDFGFPASITYFLEMDPEDSNFEEAVTLAETNETSLSLTVGEVNSSLISAGIPSGLETEVDMRIRAHINDDVPDRISETFMFAFTPYQVDIDFPEIYVPGGYQSASGYANDWSPADAPALTSPNEDDVYEGYVYFANADNQFKFTLERNWDDGDYGSVNNDGNLDQEPENNVEVDEAGYYRIDVDLGDLTYSMEQTNWGVIGDATGSWDNDQDMTYDPDSKVWSVSLDLVEGEFKFRANDEWELDYGSESANGVLQQGDVGNIPVDQAGNYTIELNLSEYPYTYTLTEN